MWVFNLLSVFQVFPLLIKKFSHKEQADLVWQFLCSIPVNTMAKFLLWLLDSVSPDVHQDIIKCLRNVVPEENLLQAVIYLLYHIFTCHTYYFFYHIFTCISTYWFWQLPKIHITTCQNTKIGADSF
jgi:hypothetical protein